MIKKTTFGRRDFLKVAGLVTSTAILYGISSNFELEPQVRYLDKMVRGTVDGKILCSTDDGRTWKTVVGFGEQLRILHLLVMKEKLIATIELDGNYFRIYSFDGSKWYTV